jgi:hypothetical protein
MTYRRAKKIPGETITFSVSIDTVVDRRIRWAAAVHGLPLSEFTRVALMHELRATIDFYNNLKKGKIDELALSFTRTARKAVDGAGDSDSHGADPEQPKLEK